jgi:hypothetical protein
LRVASENLAEVRYARGEMQIRFHSGHRWYSYSGVPEKVYRELIGASSKSEYFNRNVKEKYDVRKVG